MHLRLSCFSKQACIVMKFPLRAAFVVSYRFGVVLFSFSFVSVYFDFFLDFVVNPVIVL